MIILNSLKFKDKVFTIQDVRGYLLNGKDIQLPDGFYGGRVDKVAKTDYPFIHMLMSKDTPIDLVILNENDFTAKQLKEILEENNVDTSKLTSKQKLLEAFIELFT